jgi:uncharacterized protein YjiS (DUF1127 family)
MAVVPALIALFSPLAARGAGVMRALRNRKAVGKLAEMDARQLKDIGLTRGQVIGALQVSFLHDPSAALLGITGREPIRRAVVDQPAVRQADASVAMRACGAC